MKSEKERGPERKERGFTGAAGGHRRGGHCALQAGRDVVPRMPTTTAAALRRSSERGAERERGELFACEPFREISQSQPPAKPRQPRKQISPMSPRLHTTTYRNGPWSRMGLIGRLTTPALAPGSPNIARRQREENKTLCRPFATVCVAAVRVRCDTTAYIPQRNAGRGAHGMAPRRSTVLYCTVLYCTVLYIHT